MTKVGRQFQITLRIPEEWLTRVDAIASAMSRPGNEANRVAAIRFIVENGLEPTERELGIKAAKPKGTK
jgi:predicted DNA-binding protein